MGVRVAFEYEGRTYEVDGALHRWNIYAISNLREKISLEVDLRTGQPVFVAWGQVGVMRLTSAVDGEGRAIDAPGAAPAPASTQQGPGAPPLEPLRQPAELPAPDAQWPPPGPTASSADQQPPEPAAPSQPAIRLPPPDGRGGPPSAGWYRDPGMPDRYQLRYWDGSAWTERVS